MHTKLAASLLIVTVTSAVLVFGEPIAGSRGAVVPNGGNRRSAPTRLLRRQLDDFLEPPPLPRPVVRNRRGNWAEGTPAASPNLSIGERIARWFNPNSEKGSPSGNQLGPSADTVDMAPPPPPPHSAPSAEAVALTQQKPPPPPIPHEHDRPPAPHAVAHPGPINPHSISHPAPSRALPHPSAPHAVAHPASNTPHIPPPVSPPLDSQASGTHNIPGQYPPANTYHAPHNYPSGDRQKDCNPCNKSPWIPMAGHSAELPGGHQEAWGQASNAVPLAHAPVAFPEVHPNPLPPIFPADSFNNYNHIQTFEDNKFLPGVKDHLVPPNANLANVIFTIQEEKIAVPPEPHPDELHAARTADLQVPDQQHQNTQNIQVSPPKPFGFYDSQQASFDQQPSLFNQQPSSFNQQPSSFSQQPSSFSQQPSSFSQQPLSFSQQPSSFNQQPSSFNQQPSSFSQQPSSFNQQPSSFNQQPSSFNQQQEQTALNNQLNYHSGKNVDIVPSVPLASYIASVEYPMHYVQSPIIDISVKNNAPANDQYLPPPTAESAQFSKEPHAGLLPLQSEATAPEAAVKPAPVDSAASASISGNQDIPPCQRERYNNAHHHHDTATANSQNAPTYVQELTSTTNFESQKLHKVEPKVNLTLPTNHQPIKNNFRLIEEYLKGEPLKNTHTIHHSFGPSEQPKFEPTPSPVTSDTSLWTSPSSIAPSTITWAPEIVTEDSSSSASVTSDSQITAKPTGTKKSKQIQIIVPYSVNKDTGKVQFHRDFDHDVEDGRWLTSFAETEPATQARKVPPPLTTGKDEPFDFPKLKDFHQAQESSIVTAELSPTPWTAAEGPTKDAFAGLQHILTTDIRTLLKSEEDSVDRLRLQKNIDNWTAQEFSSVKAVRDTQDKEGNFGKSTTVSSGTSLHNKLIPSKHIPKEYLTTTPISVSSTHRIDTSPDVPRNRTDKKTTNGWTLFDNLIVPAPTRTTPSSISERQDPEIITAQPEDETTPAPWERLQVSISPITQEKVYVVTPQNKDDEVATTTLATTTTTTTRVQRGSSRSVNDFIPFRQWKESPSTASPRPRFSIRPTPGWPKGRGSKSTATPENLNATATDKSSGAPLPSRPTPRGFAVQTFSGHSKVFTATTSAWAKKKASSGDDKKTSTKATTEMTASPRIDDGVTTELYPVTADDADDSDDSDTSALQTEGPTHPEIVIVDSRESTTESARTSRTTRDLRTNRGSIRFKHGDGDGHIKRYETPPPRPKPTLHPKRAIKRPPHLVMTPSTSSTSTTSAASTTSSTSTTVATTSTTS